MNIKVENYGVVNIADHIENQFVQQKSHLLQELDVLMKTDIHLEEQQKLKEICKCIHQNDMKKAKTLLSHLSTFAKTVMRELSLSLLIDFLKSNIR